MDILNLNVTSVGRDIGGVLTHSDSGGGTGFNTDPTGTITTGIYSSLSFVVFKVSDFADYTIDALRDYKARVLVNFTVKTSVITPLTVSAYVTPEYQAVQNFVSNPNGGAVDGAFDYLNSNKGSSLGDLQLSYNNRTINGTVDITAAVLSAIDDIKSDYPSYNGNVVVFFEPNRGSESVSTNVSNVALSIKGVVSEADAVSSFGLIAGYQKNIFANVNLTSSLPSSLTDGSITLPAGSNTTQTQTYDTSTASQATARYEIIQSSASAGTLAGQGLTVDPVVAFQNAGTIGYTFSATTAQASALLKALTFTPSASGGPVSFTLQQNVTLGVPTTLGVSTLYPNGVDGAAFGGRGQAQSLDIVGGALASNLTMITSAVDGQAESAILNIHNGHASNTKSYGGVINVYAGGIDTGAYISYDFNRDAYQYVHSQETVFSGGLSQSSTVTEASQQIIMAGGTATDAQIQTSTFPTGSVQTVQAGGSAIRTTLYNRAVQTVAGAASATVVKAGGTETVTSGGVATGTSLAESGAKLVLSDGAVATSLSTVAGATISASGATTIGGLNGAGSLSITSGALNLSAAGSFSGGLSIAGGALLVVGAASGTVSLTGVVSGAGALVKQGAGTLSLSGNDTFTGGVSLLAGRLIANTAGSLGSLFSPLTLGGGTLETNADMNLFHPTHLTAASFVQVDPGSNLTLNGSLDGVGRLTKTGAGVLTLAGSNTATGGITIKEGALAVGSDRVLGPASSTLTFDGGALEATQTFTSARGFTLSRGAFQVDPTATLTLSGVLTGDVLNKTGAGVLALTGVNTYRGGTTLTAGVLSVGADTALGDSHADLTFAGGGLKATASFSSNRSVKLNAAGSVEVASGATLALTGPVSSSGSLTKTGLGTLSLAVNNAYQGGTVLTAGKLVISGNGALGGNSGALSFNGGTLETAGTVTATRAVHMQGAGTLQVDAGLTTALQGVIDGAGVLTKTGDGTLSLSGANTFTGGFILKGGALDLAAASAAGTGAIMFGDGETTLTVRGTTGLSNVISGFDTDDTLHLTGLTYIAGATATLTSGVLTITSNGATETFGHFALANGLAIGQYGLSFGLFSDVAGGTDLVLDGIGRAPLSGNTGGFVANSPPPLLMAQPTASVAENTPTTATVYSLQATGGTGALTYGLSGDDAASFHINTATGAVSFVSSPDFEQPGAADGSNTYRFNLIVSDSIGGRATQAVVLTVADVNDTAPVVISDPAASVASGTTAGTVLYTAAATDADTGGGPVTYVLGGVDAGKFDLNAATGELSFKAAPSYANPDDAGLNHVYDVTVQASDGANLSAAQAVAITVQALSANAYAPAFTSAVAVSVAENAPILAGAYLATATDGDGDVVAYALSGADAAKFGIDAVTGLVSFLNAPDFEASGAADHSNTYQIIVNASDGAGGHITSQAVAVSVIDVNDTAPVITSGGAVTVASGVTAGSAIYTAAASDADTTNGARSYALAGVDAAKFDLDAATGALSFKASPSYAAPNDVGANHVYDLTITAGDGVNTSAAQALTVTVAANVAPVFTSPSVAQATEGADDDTVVYTAAATDADHDTVAYSLVGGADAALFTIDPATGEVRFTTSPAYDAPADVDGDNVYKIVVQASDGAGGHQVSRAVAINVAEDPTVSAAPAAVAANATQVVDAGASTTITGSVSNAGTLDFARTTPLTFSGSISGTGSLAKTGGGTLNITGVNTYTGTTSVDGGLLKVNGSIANSPVMVGSGAELGGSGTTGPVTLGAGAAIGPGNSPGTLNTGSLSLVAGATYKEEVGGYGAGQFDVLNVTGTVSLGGATLNATLYGGFTAAAGSSRLVIIANDGSDPVVGTFAGLAEGAGVNVGGKSAVISYRGGDGNDVTLTFAAPAAPVTPTPVIPTPAQALTAQFANLLRAAPTSADALNASNPIYTQFQAGAAIAAQLAVGSITQAAAQTALNHLVDGTVSVATLSYAFFTGKTPTSDGLDYLVHSASNPNDLNDAYYLKFNTDNRYINFAAALAKGGAGTAAYHAAYDNLNLTDALTKAYTSIFGAPVPGKIDAILNTLVPDGLGGQETRAQYFAYYGGDGPNGAGTKGAAIGFLLSAAIKEGIGPYNAAEQHFLNDLGAGAAVYNVDLVGAYGPGGSIAGASMVELGALQ